MLHYLGSIEAIAWQIKLLLCALDIHVSVKRQYEEFYGDKPASFINPPTTITNTSRLGRSVERRRLKQNDQLVDQSIFQQDGQFRRLPVRPNQSGLRSQSARELSTQTWSPRKPRPLLELDQLVDGKTFLDYPRPVEIYKSSALLWAVYVVIKHLINEFLSEQINTQLPPIAPIQCLLMGRFILHESFASTISFVSASLIIFWHICTRWLPRSYKLTGLFFLLLSQQELDSVYLKMYPHYNGQQARQAGKKRHKEKAYEAQPSLVLDSEQADSLKPRELFILETMCFRVRHPDKVTYTLRSNRTPECHANLCKLTASIFLLVALNTLTTLPLAYGYTLYSIISGDHYKQSYALCHSMGTIRIGRIAFNWHRLIASSIDLVENLFLWGEVVLISVSAINFVFVLNHDLEIYWHKIRAKIDHLVTKAKLAREASNEPGEGFVCELQYRQVISALQAEMLDFFGQINRADVLISDYIDVALLAWLYIAASLFWTTQVKTIDRLPLDLIVLLIFIVACIVTACSILLRLQRQCARSYGTLCALMAYDCSGCWQGYGTILELFKRKKFCYTLVRSYSYQTTTFLKMLGYTFSSFFLITGLFRHQDRACQCDQAGQTGLLAQLAP